MLLPWLLWIFLFWISVCLFLLICFILSNFLLCLILFPFIHIVFMFLCLFVLFFSVLCLCICMTSKPLWSATVSGIWEPPYYYDLLVCVLNSKEGCWCGLLTKTKTKPSFKNLCSLVLTDFLLGWRRPNLITGLSGCKWWVLDWPRRTQETVPDRCRPSLIWWSFSMVKKKSHGVSTQHHADGRYPVECGTVLDLYIEHTPHQNIFKFPLNDWYDHDKQHNACQVYYCYISDVMGLKTQAWIR